MGLTLLSPALGTGILRNRVPTPAMLSCFKSQGPIKTQAKYIKNILKIDPEKAPSSRGGDVSSPQATSNPVAAFPMPWRRKKTTQAAQILYAP
jgi:hypothetical protein